jgi:hypothetical protein
LPSRGHQWLSLAAFVALLKLCFVGFFVSSYSSLPFEVVIFWPFA